MTDLSPLTLRIAAGALVFLLALALVAFLIRRKRVIEALGDADVLRQLGLVTGSTPWHRVAIPAAAGLLLAGALLDRDLASESPARGGPVVLLLDASGSMLAHDADGARLATQRQVASNLVRELTDVPIGVVAFAGRAFALTPPTRDLGAIDMYLDAVDPTIVTQSGSALGAAIRQGLGLIATEAGDNGGTIILIGDGDETDDAPAALRAAELAGRNGVRIHTVSVGSVDGGPVPSIDLSTGVSSGYLLGANGEPLISRAQPAFLQDISARSGGGRYAPAGDERSIRRIIEDVAGARSATAASRMPFYFWLLLPAFLLLLFQPAIEVFTAGREK